MNSHLPTLLLQLQPGTAAAAEEAHATLHREQQRFQEEAAQEAPREEADVAAQAEAPRLDLGRLREAAVAAQAEAEVATQAEAEVAAQAEAHARVEEVNRQGRFAAEIRAKKEVRRKAAKKKKPSARKNAAPAVGNRKSSRLILAAASKPGSESGKRVRSGHATPGAEKYQKAADSDESL